MINFTNALELLNRIRASANLSADITLKQHLLDLQGQLLNLQVQMLEQHVENGRLQNEVTRFQECLATERGLKRHFDAYMVTDVCGRLSGPFCASCWASKQRLEPLVEAGNGLGYCPLCKQTARIAPPAYELVNAS
ncbi:MAG: hypothetical protein M3Y64_04185 [Gemmatimonadota bacterium]|nr:hypothetical protein [Gemmatimonadota bacterium]